MGFNSASKGCVNVPYMISSRQPEGQRQLMNGTDYILVNRRQMEFIRTLKIIGPSYNSSEDNSINATNRPIFIKFSVYI